MWEAAAGIGAAHFSVSGDGALVYVPGISAEAVRRMLVWIDRQGREEPIGAPPRPYFYPRLSPDGTRVVFHESTASGISLMTLALAGSRQVQPLVQNSFVNENSAISPDGRWLAYESNASGRDEIHVRPFPDVAGGQWQISAAGGEQALWARNGRELFYRAPDGALMGVSVDAGPAFTTGTPKQLIDGRYYGGGTGPRRAWRTYDVSPDGRRFLMIKNPDEPQQAATAQRIIVVQNWVEELKRRVPTP